MQVALLVQKARQAINTTKEVYDIQRSHKAMLTAADISALTDADFAPFGLTKAQYVAAAAALDTMISTFETNDSDLMELYG